MILINLILFLLFLSLAIKSADYSIKYSLKLSNILKLPEFIVSFFIIAFISVLPEALISIMASLNNLPKLGFGTLIGSNIADLTLVFGIAALISSKGIKIKSKILKNNFFYLILLFFPLLLGLDGTFSRIDGFILLLAGVIFFFRIYNESKRFHKRFDNKKKEKRFFLKDLILLILSLFSLILFSNLTVKYTSLFAQNAGIPETLLGITLIAFGTCFPELVFSIKSIKENHGELALGDILGTVITDATIILGIVCLISPFSYDIKNVYLLSGAMFVSSVCLVSFMESDKVLKKLEGVLLILLYIIFLILEFLINGSL